MINVYICHPYTDDPEENVKKVRKLVEKFAYSAIAKMGNQDVYKACPTYDDDVLSLYQDVYVPVSPMLAFPEFMSEVEGVSRSHAMAFCLSLLASCEEIWVCSRDISDGMAEEISFASEHGIKVVWKA